MGQPNEQSNFPTKRIWIAGHAGMIGSAVWDELRVNSTAKLFGWTSDELDLTDRTATIQTARDVHPDALIIAAGRVGGIHENQTFPADLYLQNIQIQTNLIEAAHHAEIDRVILLSPSCVYPRTAAQPIQESALMTGPLEETSEAYSIAKIAGMMQLRANRSQYQRRWTSVVLNTVYGKGAHFSPTRGHVLPSLMTRMHQAKVNEAESIKLWGSGTPRREFIHVSDAARALVLLLDTTAADSHINVGVGKDVTIQELAVQIAHVVGYEGQILWDPERPDGAPQKLLDSRKIRALGWAPRISLEEGLQETYRHFLAASGEAPGDE